MTKLTLSVAKKELATIEMTLKKIEGEYIVNFRGGTEATAYYTNHLLDAVNTAKLMSQKLKTDISRNEVTIDGFTKRDFISYLRNTLIPDLKDSGREATAQDFETAIKFIEAK